jgi:hypothetical protein
MGNSELLSTIFFNLSISNLMIYDEKIYAGINPIKNPAEAGLRICMN